MKKITTTLLMIIAFSSLSKAQNTFKGLWLEVEKLEVENLPKSALTIVDNIYLKAEKEKNTPQIIKALFYKSKFSIILEEDAQLKIINNFKKHISTSKFPTKNVLENVLANLYWQYFTQNRYKFYKRTKTNKKINNNDFRTWDLDTLFEEIHCHFNNSLQNSELLQNTSIHDFSDILNIQKDANKYRPTLYDFLANNALNFYKSSETSITIPSYRFKIDNPSFLGDYKSFSKLNLVTKDKLSLQFHALKIYQKLIQFHLKENNLNALVDADIHRLNFVKNNATFDNKENLFFKILENSYLLNKNHESSGRYGFEFAKIIKEMNSANLTKGKKQFSNIKTNQIALNICNDIITKFPKSLGAKNCTILKNKIKEKSLSITAEKHIPINTNSLLLVNYKNINKLYFSAYKVTSKQIKALNKLYKQEEKIKMISSLNKTHNWKSTLRNEKDYLQHTTEIILPKFENGEYLIVTSENEELKEGFIYGTTFIQATNLTLIENSFNGKHNYQIVNRNNGKPVKKASINLKNNSNHEDNYIDKTLITNKNGFASFKNRKYYNNVEITVKTKNDIARFGNYYLSKNYSNNRNRNKYAENKTFLFTDRSIYRPGQTIYFKGIAIETHKGKSTIVTNENVTISLKDVNRQEIKELELKTNEFGSFTGEFIIPNNGLTGNFILESNLNFFTNSIYISVEEYKRPKFNSDFKPITDSYKLNDSITVNGFAKAFSGANITDATVVYRVYRKVQYPSWFYWRRPNFTSSAQEITHGETLTNEKGEFEIIFKAIPDESVSKENSPVFTYEITADVTDINGETRSAKTNVKIGYHSLLATILIDDKIDKTKKETTLKIDTKNLNNEFVPAKGNIKIYKLQAPKKPLRKRPWAIPDYQDISENEFRKLFPHEVYTKNESDESNWIKGNIVFNTEFNTENSKEVILKNTNKWISGKYIVVLESEDKFGQKVKDEQRFLLYSAKEKKITDNKLFTINTDKTLYKIGDEVELTIGSASKDITVTVQIEKNHKIIETCLFKLNNNTKTIKIPVEKEDLGGFAVKYHYVNYNYFNSGTLLINVPEKIETINIETNIFRDKLQPGEDETWSFTIKNDKNNAIAAEVLASMYDASLDAFTSHNWYFNPIKPKSTYYSYAVSNAYKSFKTTKFNILNNRKRHYGFFENSYNSYNWFGFSLNGNRWQYQQYLRETERKINRSRKDFDGLLTGFVADNDGNPLPGVSIVIKDTKFGTETDFDGNYSIKIKKGDILVFNYIGFKPNLFTINDQTNLDVALEEDSLQLDEVVVVGYGTSRKNRKASRIARTLKGKAAGVQKMIVADSKTFEVEETIIESTETDESEFIEYEDQLKTSLNGIKARKNFNETAFFFPQLRTDKDGKVSFSFTMPEALTRWKLQLLAHTKELKSSTKTLQTVTQKELMIVPNAPRFLREGDKITLSAKITNLTNNTLSGFAKLILNDAITGKEINTELDNLNSNKNFTVDKEGNTNVSWQLSIPETVQAVQYKIVAKAGDFSDGEQNVLPVLSNRMLVTETLPMWIRSNQTKTFTLDKLKNNTSSTLKNHKLTLEMTSNPVWYAIQSLPYLMEYPYECAEQTFSRYYANTLASFVANSNPRIQEVFNAWKSSDALLSNLEKNQELKSLIIQETPWLRDAQSETEQKKRIALLFDLNKMKNEQDKAINKLKDIQMNSGGFPWFKGSRYPSTFITQHIATGFSHLQKLGVTNFDNSTQKMIKKSVHFLDNELVKQYNKLLERASEIKEIAKTKKKGEKAYRDYLAKNNLDYFNIQYLYMRSFYTDLAMNNDVKSAVSYYQNQTEKYWNDYNLYAKGQIALSLFRSDKKQTSNRILKSLKENSITSDELGMYWKSNTAGYYYYQAPIETQALLIETFSEIENDTKTIDNLKVWLLKNKQTNRWKTTKATTEAVYALLLNGSDWISVTEMVDIQLGNQKINPLEMKDVKVEAGSGYFKTSWNGNDIKKEMANVTINKKGNGIAWGSLYWQYFEDLDKITSAETPLKLNKKLFLKVNSDKGKLLKEITDNSQLKVGDLITVRIELRSDRNMEFIHMKDMRASGVEPVNVLSKYKWQDNLGYYESTKDAATNFFFDRLPKGVYVFEYDVRVNNAGNFSNGITTIQSMYAPEFSSHSKGVRIQVK